MKVQYQGIKNHGRPVVVSTTETISRNDLVEIDANGKMVAATDAATTGLAVAGDDYPDTEYQGTKTDVVAFMLGEGCEVRVPFTNTSTLESLAQADIGAGPFPYDSTADKINLSTTTNGVFVPTGIPNGTDVGDRSGTLVGYFIDSSVFGGN